MTKSFSRDEFNELFTGMNASTADDVSITTDGRRLDNVDAVMEFIEQVALERAVAERGRAG